jgi:hypothetical protein
MRTGAEIAVSDVTRISALFPRSLRGRALPPSVFERKESAMDECTCHLEDAFQAFDESACEIAPFGVIDAECEVVATCTQFAYAKLVAWALNKATLVGPHRCCILHSQENNESV